MQKEGKWTKTDIEAREGEEYVGKTDEDIRKEDEEENLSVNSGGEQ